MAEFRQLIHFFAMDFTVTDTAELTDISVRSINQIFIQIRQKIAQACVKLSFFKGVIKLDLFKLPHKNPL